MDTYPSLDGNTVLFQDITNGANSLRVVDALGGGKGLVEIADFQTPMPGGGGTFTRFDDQTARVQDGIILFEGLDSNTSVQIHGGLYTASAGGGTINRVFDYHTTHRAGIRFIFHPKQREQRDHGWRRHRGDYDFENGIVAFYAITDGDVTHDNADGTGIFLLANRSHDATPAPFPVNQCFSVALHSGTTVVYGATVFAPYAIFSSPKSGGLSALVRLASLSTPLPGGHSPETGTAYFTGFDHFDHMTGSLVFAAHDGCSINSLYRLPDGSLGSGVITMVVDNHTVLPGTTTPAAYFDGAPFPRTAGRSRS